MDDDSCILIRNSTANPDRFIGEVLAYFFFKKWKYSNIRI